MSDYNEIKKEAETLFKQKKHAQAEAHYRRLFDEHEAQCNRYDALHYLQTVKEQNRHAKALKLCRRFFPLYKDFAPIRNLYAWSIYYTEIKDADEQQTAERLKKAALAVARLCRHDDKFAPYGLSLLKAAAHKNMSPEGRAKLTALLKPDLLSDKSYEFTGGNGKTIALPSDLERYYALRSKALRKTGEYDAALELVEEAFERIKTFHAGNEIWLERTACLALFAKKQYKAAAEKAENLLMKKSDWFIQKELAEIYLADKRTDDALLIACKAALQSGPPEKKVRLFALMADILKMKERPNLAVKHRLLEYRLRRENDWYISDKTQEALQNTDAAEKDKTAADWLSELKDYWNKVLSDKQERIYGQVINILPHGGAGFVADNRGKNYYFSAQDFKGDDSRLQKHQRVSFVLEPAYDKKKGQQSLRAADIRPETEPPDKTRNE
jgi:hypothetical protein